MANHYIREGATGAGTAGWGDTQAQGSMPTSFVRGDVYYVADGTYTTPASSNLSTAASGTTLITIQKATIADHGTSTGWLDTYGDGQAVFNGGWEPRTAYWLVDGVTGGGPGVAGGTPQWNLNYGFKIIETGDDNAMFRVGYNGASANNITIRHIEFQGKGSLSTSGGSFSNDGIGIVNWSSAWNSSHDFTASYIWVHDVGRCPVFIASFDAQASNNYVFEYFYVQSYFGGVGQQAHSEVMSATNGIGVTSITWRYSLIAYVIDTGGIMWDNQANHNALSYVYGNVFYRPASVTWGDGSDLANGAIGGWTGAGGEDFFNMHVYNNSFITINIGSVIGVKPARFGNNDSYNNLFYNITVSPDWSRYSPADYNHYIASGGNHGEAHGTTTASGDPFVNYVGLDFRLTANTTAGNATAVAGNNTDMYGTTRTTWTRGAIEFGSSGGGDTTPPTAPSNLLATAISISQINLSWTASTDAVGVTSYLMERALGAGSFSQIGTSAITTFSSTGLAESTTYRYQVRATDAANNLSGYSNIVSQATLSVPPAAPTGVTIR